MSSGGEDSLRRAEELLERLETVRAKLDTVEDPDEAIEVMAELNDIAKAAHAELERARDEAT